MWERSWLIEPNRGISCMKRDISPKLLALWPSDSRLNNYIALISEGLANPRGLHCGGNPLILIARVRVYRELIILRVKTWFLRGCAGNIPLYITPVALSPTGTSSVRHIRTCPDRGSLRRPRTWCGNSALR